MQTKLRFKIIASLILLSLAGVIVSQGYWLKGLYDRLWDQTALQIEEAMRMAEYKELFLRIEQVAEKEKAEKGDTGMPYTKTWKATNPKPQINRPQTDSLLTPSGTTDPTRPEMNIVYVENKEKEDIMDKLYAYLKEIGNVERYIQETIHYEIDSIYPIRYEVYDSLLYAELTERGIRDAYFVEILQANGDTARRMYISERHKETDQWHSAAFEYTIPNGIIYRATLKAPQQIVLREMAGLLVSSVLIFILILVAFGYLLYTIFRQKTVEELKADFTNNVTHELKTPIAIAYAANDALLNYTGQVGDKQKKYLTIIKEQLTYLTGMVEQILTLSAGNRSAFKLVIGNVMVEELLPSLQEQHRLKSNKEIIFPVDMPSGLAVQADRRHLYNMLSNLIENSIKYTTAEPVKISIRGWENEHEVCIAVADNGIGIDAKYQQQVFEKFFRVPQGNLHIANGYGLGLYYIQDMMTRHKGKVSLQSQPGKGSVFTLHFNK